MPACVRPERIQIGTNRTLVVSGWGAVGVTPMRYENLGLPRLKHVAISPQKRTIPIRSRQCWSRFLSSMDWIAALPNLSIGNRWNVDCSRGVRRNGEFQRNRLVRIEGPIGSDFFQTVSHVPQMRATSRRRDADK